MPTTGDYRVPITQSYRFYHALRDRGVPTQVIGYPVAGHRPSDPVRGLGETESGCGGEQLNLKGGNGKH